MNYTAKEVYQECIKQFTGIEGRVPLGKTDIKNAIPGTLSEKIASYLISASNGRADKEFLPYSRSFDKYFADIEGHFSDYYKDKESTAFFKQRAEIIFNSNDPLLRACAVSELWSPDLALNDDEIYNSWLLSDVKRNDTPYKPEDILIQLNALYSPAALDTSADVSAEITADYKKYIEGNPEKIAVYDHPVPLFTRGEEHELEKCLVELDADVKYEKECGIIPFESRLKVLISISTTHKNLDTICESWLQEVLAEYNLENVDCFLLSENKSRTLDKLIGKTAEIFTVQGKYACHFGALKYAQLIFEKAYGIRAGFKLDTDEGIHSKDMKEATGQTWFEQLCHPYWGGTGVNKAGEKITLGFNIGEYVDSRDLDALGYAEAIRTPEVKLNKDLRGPYLLFNKGACQAKGTMLLNRGTKLEDFISHPLVKGGGYGVDNNTLREAVPVGFSMVGRAEDQQFYYSAINNGFQGIFNPQLRIIHYKANVVKSEHQNEVGRNIADIYRMLLFRELMDYLDIINKTRPFPANYASSLSISQVFFLWLFLILKASAEGDEATAEEYLTEGTSQLLPLLEEIDNGKVVKLFEQEGTAWTEFTVAVDNMKQADAVDWLERLRI